MSDYLGGTNKQEATTLQRPSLTRAWGDGAGDTRTHVVEDISWAQLYIECRCGRRLTATSSATLEARWNIHRGKDPVAEANKAADAQLPRATDDEVAEFLAAVADGRMRASVPDQLASAGPSAEDIEIAQELFQRFLVMRDGCTCTPGSDIYLCPNYVPGDEEGD